MKNYNTVLTEMQQKYQYYYLEKLKKKNEYITVEEILRLDQRRVIEQVKFTYSTLGKPLEKLKKTKNS